MESTLTVNERTYQSDFNKKPISIQCKTEQKVFCLNFITNVFQYKRGFSLIVLSEAPLCSKIFKLLSKDFTGYYKHYFPAGFTLLIQRWMPNRCCHQGQTSTALIIKFKQKNQRTNCLIFLTTSEENIKVRCMINNY